MKTGMNLLLWTSEVTAEQDAVLDELKAIGFNGVEIPIFNIDPSGYQRLGDRLKAIGLGATAVTVMTPEANPISAETSVRDAAVERLSRVLECCQASGATLLCGPLHSALGEFSGVGPTEDEFRRGVETMQRAGEKAKAAGVQLAVEYLNRFEIYFLTTAAQTKRFVDAVDHPSVKMMYDSFHAHIEERSQAEAIAHSAPRIVHAHVSENDRGTPGAGQVDWDGYFGGLKQAGYDGYYTIEAFGRALPDLAAATKVWRDQFDNPMQLCRDGLAHIKKHVES